ncbi:MAG TPA: metallophosphoesterase [Pyrinomonadaceae bacterium]
MRIPKLRKKLLLKITAAALALGLVLTVIYVFFIEPNRLVVKEVTISLRDWPAKLENLKVAVLSDLHVGAPFINSAKLQLIVSKVNQAEPDLIVLLGDFISFVRGGTVVEPETIAENIRGLRARYGVFAVLGNHDWTYGGERVRRALEDVGIRVLENDVARIELNDQAMWVAGITDAWTNRADITGTLKKVTDESPVIVITHNPDLFPLIPARVSLTLAGHTHGGQVIIPFFGRRHVPSEFGQRYAAGHIVEENRHLYVTTGIGTSIIPVRFRVPPEIVILTLTSSHSTAR